MSDAIFMYLYFPQYLVFSIFNWAAKYAIFKAKCLIRVLLLILGKYKHNSNSF